MGYSYGDHKLCGVVQDQVCKVPKWYIRIRLLAIRVPSARRVLKLGMCCNVEQVVKRITRWQVRILSLSTSPPISFLWTTIHYWKMMCTVISIVNEVNKKTVERQPKVDKLFCSFSSRNTSDSNSGV